MTEHNLWVRPIGEVGVTDAPTVGGKSANLGELTRAGFPVPAAFAVTTDAYLDAMGAAQRLPHSRKLRVQAVLELPVWLRHILK